MGHKVVVAGRGNGHMGVEVFDSEIGTWESYGDLPEEFSGNVWSRSMSGVVLDNKFYAVPLRCKIGEFKIHFLDLSTKQWASVQLESPMGLVLSNIMAIGPTLVIAGFSEGNCEEQYLMKLWKVDMKTLRLTQVGLMPIELDALMISYNFFEDGGVIYPVDENLVFVRVNEWLFIVAEVSLEECKTYWHRLPCSPDLDRGVYYKFIHFWASISSA